VKGQVLPAGDRGGKNLPHPAASGRFRGSPFGAPGDRRRETRAASSLGSPWRGCRNGLCREGKRKLNMLDSRTPQPPWVGVRDVRAMLMESNGLSSGVLPPSLGAVGSPGPYWERLSCSLMVAPRSGDMAASIRPADFPRMLPRMRTTVATSSLLMMAAARSGSMAW